MTVWELNREQIKQLKETYLMQHLDEVEGRSPSYGELALADELVADAMLVEAYGHYDFSEDDFRN